MSVDRTPAGNAAARIPPPACGAPSASTCTAQSHWRQERLIEARGILADIVHHPDTLVFLACRVVCGCGSDAIEQADALCVMRLLSKHPHEVAGVAPNGGAA